MSKQIVQQIEKEEELYSSQVSKELMDFLNSKSVKAQANKVATCSVKKGPNKELVAFYEEQLKKQLKGIKAKFKSCEISTTLDFEEKKGEYIPSVKATVKYETEMRGGGEHVTEPGDTLLKIALLVYGNSAYWPYIYDANPVLSSSGNLILASMKLKTPKVHVPTGVKNVAVKETRIAIAKAMKVAYPTMEVQLEKMKKVDFVAPATGGKLVGYIALKGTLVARRKGTIPVTFKLKEHTAEVVSAGSLFTSGLEFDGMMPSSISISNTQSKFTGTAKLTLTSSGAVKFSMMPKPVKFSLRGLEFEGNVGWEGEARFVPDAQEKGTWESVGDWLQDHREEIRWTLIGATVTAAIVITVLTPIPGDEVVAYGAAMKLLERAAMAR